MIDDQKFDRRRKRLRREQKATRAKAKRRKARALDLQKHLREKARIKGADPIHTLEEGWWCWPRPS